MVSYQVVRSLPLTHWCQSLDLVLDCPLIAMATNGNYLYILQLLSA